MRIRSYSVALLMGFGFLAGCGSPADESAESTARAEAAVMGVDTWAYLRCNATGWNVDDSTRLKPSANPNQFTLDFNVTQDWMVSSNDGCIITVTNQFNGWGSSSSARTLATSPVVPSAVAALTAGWNYFFVDYAQKGAYRATVDFAAGTFVITPAATPPTATELVETSILTRWSSGSSDGATTQLSQIGPSAIVAGTAALRAVTDSGFDFWLRYQSEIPLDGASKGYLGLAVRALNTTPSGWQINGPVVVIEDSSGSRLTLSPTSQYLSSDGSTWTDVRVPLAGGLGWEASGAANLQQVTAIELHADTWESGFTLDVDNVRFTGAFDACASAPTTLSAQSTARATTATVSYTSVAGALGYNVYRGLGSATPTFLTRARKTTFEDFGLPLNTSVKYEIRPVLAGGCESGSAVTTALTSASGSGLLKTPNLKVLVPIYKGGTYPYTAEDIVRIKAGIEVSRQFYYRQSRGRVNLELDFMEIDAGVPDTSGPTIANVEVDLRNRGILDDQYDAVYPVALDLAGCFGGFRLLGNTAGAFGTACGVPYPTTDPGISTELAWSFTHEFQHAFDFVLAEGSGADMIHGHPDAVYQDMAYSGPVVDAGEHYDWERATLRAFTGYLTLAAPHNKYLESQDTDGDGLANSDARLPTDEARFASNANAADSDNDGLTDLGEYAVGSFAGSNPSVADTDGDGLLDGVDSTPRAALASAIAPLSPVVDGVRDSGYTLFRNGVEFTSVVGFTAATYFAYDANYLYVVAEESAPASVVIYIDGSGTNGFWQGDDTYAVSLSPNAAGPLNHTEIHGTNAPGASMPGALLVTRVVSGKTILEARIPNKNLGPGYGWTGGVTSGFSTAKGNVLGLRIWFSQINGTGGLQEEPWATQNELWHFDDVTLN